MESKYTPAPWLVITDEGSLNDQVAISMGSHIDHEGVYDYCDLWLSDSDSEDLRALANAQLIAAAPELLEALEEVVAISDRHHNSWIKAKSVIKKARGE